MLYACAHENAYQETFQQIILSGAVSASYSCDENRNGCQIIIDDKMQGIKYQVIRDMKNKELKLERMLEEED